MPQRFAWLGGCWRNSMRRRPKKASGANIPESQRGTVQVKLRLPYDVAEALDELAAKKRVTRSGLVAMLLEEAAR